MNEHFLVTGAMGCLGSWAVRQLIAEGAGVTTLDIRSDPYRMRLIMSEADLDRVDFVDGDITDLDAVERVIDERRITRILHLAALQVPFCRADPVLGMRVNAVGTAVVLEAARRHDHRVRGLVYCSSVAAYGAGVDEPGRPVGEDAPRRPDTIYGVTKLANEETARVYWQDHGVSSVGFRPHTVYGVGRDQGLTSTPTKAMLAAAAGRPYRITHCGTWTYQHAGDAARCLIKGAQGDITGAPVFNMGGSVVDMAEMVKAIEQAAPAAAGMITVADTPLPLAAVFDDSALRRAMPELTWRSLADGVGETVDAFRRLIATKAIDVERVLG